MLDHSPRRTRTITSSGITAGRGDTSTTPGGDRALSPPERLRKGRTAVPRVHELEDGDGRPHERKGAFVERKGVEAGGA